MPELCLEIYQLVQQIKMILQQLTDEQYRQPLAVFHQSSIGQHTRHTIEFFEELEEGYKTGIVNYDNRKRNKIYEADRYAALSAFNEISSMCQKADKALQLSFSINETQGVGAAVATTYFRELVFAIDHTVHHIALIRVGAEQFTNVVIPSNFGVATSTIHHRNVCAQ